MKKSEIIEKTIDFARNKLQNFESGHDFWHSYRVWQLVKKISSEYNFLDFLVIEIAALLHDLTDRKFNNNSRKNEKIIYEFLISAGIDQENIKKIFYLINNVSFSNKNNSKNISDELKILQDADRLDAIGAIGIARAFSYGGYKKREFYNPQIKPKYNMNKKNYKNHKSTTINHFYEKLLSLKDGMHTKIGKKLAIKRHNFMFEFLHTFYQEWNL